jgi:hypothetical protein
VNIMSLPENRRLRVVQWTTGHVAAASIRAILERPNLELVGVYAFSKDKVGRDAGELIGLGRRIGIAATDDIAALIALRPDVVVYMPLHPNVDHMEQLLRAGINVVTTASFMTGRGYGAEATRRLEDAARSGKASLFGSGINSGWIDSVVSSASGLCQEVSLVRVTESFNIGLWAAESNQDVLGWGRPAGDPGHAQDIEKATLPFGDAVEAIAHMFRFPLDQVRCEVEFAHAIDDLDVPGRSVRKGTVAGILARWLGVSNGRLVIELNAQWALSPDITPEWDIAMAYLVDIQGKPGTRLRVEVLPEDPTLPLGELRLIGHVITAMPVVNAIPAVVAARPGIVSYADFPPVTSVLRASDRNTTPGQLALRPAEKPVPAAGPETAPGPTPATIAGTWNVTIKTPGGGTNTVLAFENDNGVLSGTQSAQGQSTPLTEIRLEGSRISWVNVVTKPMKLSCRFSAEVSGGRMAGKMKAGIMGSFAFSAEKT